MNFNELVNIVSKLRSPDGCPWDREQTKESLRPFLIEEFYEVIDALDDNDVEGTKEELGDLLFQILIQSQLSKEEGDFSIDDVVEGIASKMVGRHPHVFGDKELKTSDDVEVWWEQRKKEEGKVYRSVLSGVPRSLPALLRATELQKRATRVGFDWEHIEDIVEKLEEEVGELKDAIAGKKRDEIEAEFGDILFVLVRISSFMNVDAETALGRTNNKFIKRFSHIEEEASIQGKKLSEMTLGEMEALWNRAKEK